MCRCTLLLFLIVVLKCVQHLILFAFDALMLRASSILLRMDIHAVPQNLLLAAEKCGISIFCYIYI